MGGDARRPDSPPTAAVRLEVLEAIAASRGQGPALHDDAFVDEWILSRRRGASLAVRRVPLGQLDGWRREAVSGNLVHSSGRFFSVLGIRCRHRIDRFELEWDQPILEQPEVGILGILARNIDGVLHLCLQAKEEPGNLGGVQLSPTVQATFSNYTRVHGGAPPPFLEHFVDPDPERVLFARLQTEDGGRFLYKSNRNMIVDVGPGSPAALPEGFIWLTLRQIAALLRRDDLVNACARSVLASLLHSATGPGGARGPAGSEEPDPRSGGCPDGIWETLQWLDDRRAANHLVARRIGLSELQDWRLDEEGFFSHRQRRFFRVVGMEVTSTTRETRAWSQPLLEGLAPGVIGLLLREGRGGLELLMQAKAEVGNRSAVQLGPTVQFTQANYVEGGAPGKPLLFEDFLAPGAHELVHESRQSEEGGRFYRESHVHRVLRLRGDGEPKLTDDYRWLPLSHVRFLLHLGEQVNACARSILACLPPGAAPGERPREAA